MLKNVFIWIYDKMYFGTSLANNADPDQSDYLHAKWNKTNSTNLYPPRGRFIWEKHVNHKT